MKKTQLQQLIQLIFRLYEKIKLVTTRTSDQLQ